MKSCRLTILACLLAVFPAHADDTYAVSPSFALTTLDPLGTIVGVSAGFTLDTTAQSGLTGYGVSAFVLDTRPPTVTEPTSAEVTIISNNSIALTGYTGPGGYVIIPGIIGNLPVTSIGNGAFQNNATITSVFIPASVTGIGVGAFANCPALMAITVDPANPTYSNSADGVLFDKHFNTLIQYPAGRYAVEASADLQNWSATGVTVSAPDGNGKCTATVPLSGGQSFLRPVVSY